jgi:hypothetical protein
MSMRLSPAATRVLILAAALCQPLAAAASARAAASAGSGAAACPPAVSVRQEATAPAGWDVRYDRTGSGLAAVTFFEGPPEANASLVYDEQLPKGRETWAVWRFAAGGSGIWISCAYDGTRALLSRRLPATVRSCTVKYEAAVTNGGGLPAIKAIDCK